MFKDLIKKKQLSESEVQKIISNAKEKNQKIIDAALARAKRFVSRK